MQNERESVSGLSFIEVVLILVLIALVGTMAIPQLVARQPHTLEGSMEPSKMETEHVVRVALSLANADLKQSPSVSSLALYVQAEQVEALDDGIRILWKEQAFTVATYTDANCGVPTRSTNDAVLCVGDAAG